MRSPSDEYKFLRNINNINDIANFQLFEKYIIQDIKGDKKKIGIEDTNQEEIIATRNGGYPIPGMIYTFIYEGPNAVVKGPNGEIEYKDFVPLLFCMTVTRSFFSGINLNTLPTSDRLDFLDSFYETFKDFFIDVERKTQNDKLALNKRFLSYIRGGQGQQMIKLFNQKNSANYNFGYRKYLAPKVNRLRMVEFNEWYYIPFYTPKNAFRKMSHTQLHNLYRRGG